MQHQNSGTFVWEYFFIHLSFPIDNVDDMLRMPPAQQATIIPFLDTIRNFRRPKGNSSGLQDRQKDNPPHPQYVVYRRKHGMLVGASAVP